MWLWFTFSLILPFVHGRLFDSADYRAILRSFDPNYLNGNIWSSNDLMRRHHGSLKGHGLDSGYERLRNHLDLNRLAAHDRVDAQYDALGADALNSLRRLYQAFINQSPQKVDNNEDYYPVNNVLAHGNNIHDGLGFRSSLDRLISEISATNELKETFRKRAGIDLFDDNLEYDTNPVISSFVPNQSIRRSSNLAPVRTFAPLHHLQPSSTHRTLVGQRDNHEHSLYPHRLEHTALVKNLSGMVPAQLVNHRKSSQIFRPSRLIGEPVRAEIYSSPRVSEEGYYSPHSTVTEHFWY